MISWKHWTLLQNPSLKEFLLLPCFMFLDFCLTSLAGLRVSFKSVSSLILKLSVKFSTNIHPGSSHLLVSLSSVYFLARWLVYHLYLNGFQVSSSVSYLKENYHLSPNYTDWTWSFTSLSQTSYQISPNFLLMLLLKYGF